MAKPPAASPSARQVGRWSPSWPIRAKPAYSDLFRIACQHELEGIVSKRLDKPYGSGRPGRSDGTRLIYAGTVGTGFSDAAQRQSRGGAPADLEDAAGA